LWLPAGRWLDAQSGERLTGTRRLDRRLRLDQIALYVRGGSPLEATVPLL
jgi:alpha-glucosidase (family GH31 glycosyl hydrolase)